MFSGIYWYTDYVLWINICLRQGHNCFLPVSSLLYLGVLAYFHVYAVKIEFFLSPYILLGSEWIFARLMMVFSNNRRLMFILGFKLYMWRSLIIPISAMRDFFSCPIFLKSFAKPLIAKWMCVDSLILRSWNNVASLACSFDFDIYIRSFSPFLLFYRIWRHTYPFISVLMHSRHRKHIVIPTLSYDAIAILTIFHVLVGNLHKHVLN